MIPGAGAAIAEPPGEETCLGTISSLPIDDRMSASREAVRQKTMMVNGATHWRSRAVSLPNVQRSDPPYGEGKPTFSFMHPAAKKKRSK